MKRITIILIANIKNNSARNENFEKKVVKTYHFSKCVQYSCNHCVQSYKIFEYNKKSP